MNKDELLEAIEKKYEKLGVPLNTMLEGLLHSTPTTYWDYIQTDALLGLQIPRTKEKDEMVFIMYHQVNELLFKMILWEIDQISLSKEPITAEKFSKHLMRISRYFDMLCSSFSVMGDRNSSFRNAFEHLYWQAAGKNHQTGEKSILIKLFEKKYMGDFIDFMEDYNECNLSKKFKQLPKDVQNNKELIDAMRHYDYTVNVKWVLAHYDAAGKYLGGGDKDIEATGGSNWRKYMHPKYQRRIFFPYLWSEEELKNWGTF